MFGQVNLEKLCSKIMNKNFALALFSPLGPWTGNDFLFGWPHYLQPKQAKPSLPLPKE